MSRRVGRGRRRTSRQTDTRKGLIVSKMQTVRQISECREALRRLREGGARIGFVPTMGALHEGHLSLIRRAREDGCAVVVSIFVNPTQFCPGEDYEAYPRTLERDLEVCRREGVALVFAPDDAEMYPPPVLTRVHVERLTENLCGAFRPGHFDGVTTVVAKLFNIIQPDVAYFGQKDAQQAVVIRQMVRDLNFPVQIVVCPIVREPDGLALSSRNAYLSPQERERALALSRALLAAQQSYRQHGPRPSCEVEAEVREALLSAGPCRIDYVEIVDAQTLRPLPRLEPGAMIAAAVRIGRTRLIDNVVIDAEPEGGG